MLFVFVPTINDDMYLLSLERDGAWIAMEYTVGPSLGLDKFYSFFRDQGSHSKDHIKLYKFSMFLFSSNFLFLKIIRQLTSQKGN